MLVHAYMAEKRERKLAFTSRVLMVCQAYSWDLFSLCSAFETNDHLLFKDEYPEPQKGCLN